MMLKERIKDTPFMEDEFTQNFTPYEKLACRIDELLSLLNFYRVVGGDNPLKAKQELEKLRKEIAFIRSLRKV